MSVVRKSALWLALLGATMLASNVALAQGTLRIGMTASEIKRLFRPFTQAHEGIAKRFGGTGLGLSLVKRLARAMGGDLTVTSTPGRGSTFELTVVVALRAGA